ncbi:MAG: sulfatase-like hydrolase/transferase [Thermoanaerobaculia bacterium]
MPEEAPKVPWLGVLAVAAVHGFVAAFGLTLARWLTAEPYSPAIIRWDVAVCVLGFTVVYATARLVLPPAALHRRWASIATAAAALYLTSVWATGLAAALAATRIAGWTLLGVAAAVFVRNIATARQSRWTLGWTLIAAGTAIALGMWLPFAAKIPSLLFPAVLLAMLWSGQPRSEPRPSGRMAAPILVQVALIAVCSFAVFPISAWRVGLPSPEAGRRERPPGASSVVMIVLDNLRRDHLSLYGYERRTTPRLDRWAADGLVFDDATAASCWTLPSHASLFTGLYPRTHGAHSYRGDARWANAYALPEEETTLAEAASREGITTAAIISNSVFLAPRFGLGQGFSTYWAEAPRQRVAYPPAELLARAFDLGEYVENHWAYYRARYMTDNAIRWLKRTEDRQFFLFLNYMDVHQPNWRPPNEVVPYVPGEETFVDPGATQGAGIFLERRALPPDVRAYRIDHYDRELLLLDRELDRLFLFLDASGLSESTAVILISDHGEYFGEHGMTGHSGHLHGEVVDIPLVIKGPGVRRGRSSRPTHLIELFGTALDFLGVDSGRSGTYSSVFDEESHPPIVSEWYASDSALLLQPRMQGRFDRDVRALEADGLKLFEDSRGGVALHDLTTSGGENVDLAPARPQDVDRLRAELRQWMEDHPASERVARTDAEELDEEARERLKALGYLD